MDKAHKWQMNRAGLFNFWYYDDEIFDFADGKLLLRGSNGSGKSVTMQSILPVLLDGRKSPDRLDPFGSKARKMEDYLLGEKGIVDRDERTGYLFIEYKRQDTNQFITTGIGMQARRNKGINSWYFVITDNRRIGKNFLLYETQTHAGEKQQIPLSRVQLENRINDGGHVVRTQNDYKNLVNKYIFGFETAEAYEDLIKLLIQLRSPKLSKDFKPTVIYEILEAALPPLTDEDLRHLSDTIEHMDQTKQQIEQLQREREALGKLIKRYDVYNTYQITEKARQYVQTKKRFSQVDKQVQNKIAEEKQLGEKIEKLQARSHELTQTIDVLEQKQSRLQQHEVWNLEEERAKEDRARIELEEDMAKKDKQLTEKKRQELKSKETLNKLENDIAVHEKDMKDILSDLQADAEEAAFDNHTLNEQDFLRNLQTTFDFSVWRQEAGKHYERLEKITEQLRMYEQLKNQVIEFQKRIGSVNQQMDKARQEEKDWLNIFENDKQDKLSEIYQWAERYGFFDIDETMLQTSARLIDTLYEGHMYEEIRTQFVKVNNDFQMGINEQIAGKKSELNRLTADMEEKQAELATWKGKRDPEPPFQREETRHARKLLREKGDPFIPFYEAVEFQEDVPDTIRKRIEAALLDAGVLDALITSGKPEISHDRVIVPNPNMMAHTLADYLVPDTDDDAPISKTLIDEVLRSVLVDDVGSATGFSLNEDGTYRLGLMQGHAVEVEAVRFIGKSARQRYRLEQIADIEQQITQLKEKEQEIKVEISVLTDRIMAANDAIAVFPDDKDLHEGFRQITEKRFEITQLDKELQRLDRDMQETNHSYQEVKRELDEQTRHLNIAFHYADFTQAKRIMHDYEKTLSALVTHHTSFCHLQERWMMESNRLEELAWEVNDLLGETHSLQDKITRIISNLAEIEKQLAAQGVEDIRKQIQELQRDLQASKEELDLNKETVPEKKSARGVLLQEIDRMQHKAAFLQSMSHAWLAAFKQEADFGFIKVPEDLQTDDDRADWVEKTYKDQLQDKDPAKVSEQLTKVFYEQLPNLMEYRMDEKQASIDKFDWMQGDFSQDQRIELDDWQQRVKRRVIQLDFEGKRVSPYYVLRMVENDQLRQQNLLDDQDRKLYEEILFDSVGKKLRSRIARAQSWTEKMDKLMADSDSSSGLSFSIKWKPRTAETEAELDTKELVDLLRRDPRLLKDEDIDQVIEHFRSKISRAKELVELKGEGSTLLQVLKEVLDYRYWFSFVLSFKREGEPKRELTDHAFFQFSGGEKAMAMYIPLFTACYSRYKEAAPTAPYIISLDEAFAGVDEDNISVMFRVVEQLGFDYMMNSQVLWGDYDTIPALSVCELVRPKNQDFVTVIRYHWDGSKRSLVVDDEEAMSDESEKDPVKIYF